MSESTRFFAARLWPRVFTLALVWLSLTGAAFAQNLVLNPSFETAGPANWTLTTTGAVFAGTSGATDGVLGVSNSSVGDGTLVLYQDVSLPATGTYTIQMAIGVPLMGSDAKSFVRADITNTNAATIVAPTPGVDTLATTSTADVLQNVFSRDGTQGSIAQADTAAIDITGLAGQSVRVRVMLQHTGFFGHTDMRLDNVRLIRTAPVAVVPTLSEWALISFAMLIVGFGVYQQRRRQL
jgi:hypothetical protein